MTGREFHDKHVALGQSVLMTCGLCANDPEFYGGKPLTPELRPCRNCGTLIVAPATVCSEACYSEVYGETRAELYDDERHVSGVEDDETESED